MDGPDARLWHPRLRINRVLRVMLQTSNAGKDAHPRVQKVGQPDVTEIRTWGADERISVRRTGRAAEEGKG